MLYKYSFLDSKTDCCIVKRVTFVGKLNKRMVLSIDLIHKTNKKAK
jgi:hypothetical protein